jgi:metacaspase-1
MLTNLCFRKSIRFIILIQTLLFSIESHSQDKYALLMGISEYPVSSEWPSTYADNDLNLIKNSLIYRGFKQEHIFLLLDSQCTREGILSAFNDSLLPILTKGSMVYIHYSGLGQQFIDLDYTEPDGFDEAIVPYDAPPKYIEASFSPSRFILDDELESYFSKIQHKLGAAGQLLVTMDSYSAPDRIRSTAKARGNNDYSESTREDFHTFFSISPEQKSKAPMISIHNSDQNTGIQEFYSREYGSFGLFSYAIAKSIATLSQHSNYDSWFQEIRSFMKHQTVKQNPILFGGVKKFAFNDMLSKKKMFYRIDKIYSKDLVKIEGGSLHQFEKGTEMLIYAPDVEDTTGRNLLGRGVVEQVNLLQTSGPES